MAASIWIYRNGSVFDGVGFLPRGIEVRVRGRQITHVGSDLPTAGAEVVDLAGGTLLPGFIDAHIHPVFAGNQLRHCDLREGSTLEDYLRIITGYSDSHPDETWITGGGWAMEAFPGGLPTREPLDRVVPDRPVFLPNQDGHGAWVNSRALRLAGIDRHSPDPRDGRIERDDDGEPTGMLQEGAADLVSRLLPTLTDDDWYAALQLAQDHLIALGITGWQDAIVGAYAEATDPLPTYLRAAGDGSLRASVVGALWWDRERGAEQIEELVYRRSLAEGDRFRPTSVKLMLDGVAETHTAAMLEPYQDHHGCASENTGLDFIDPQELPRYVAELDRLGFQAHFHALGDRAVRNALDAIAAARKANGPNGPAHHLAHVQVVHPEDVGRFAALGATANLQPFWAAHDAQMDELTIPFLGERRSGWQYPFRSLETAGSPLCAGSDWPVSTPNPLLGAHVAVNRQLPGGSDAEVFLGDQRLTLTTILAAYTSGSARVNGVEDHAGALRAGLDADLVTVDADLATLADHEIGSAHVTSTWIRGELAFGDTAV